MKVIKRDGTEVSFDKSKIRTAIGAANADIDKKDRLSVEEADFLAGKIEKRCEALGRAVTVEEIQDMVIDALDESEHYKLARHYSDYRLRHELLRKQSRTDARVLSLLRHDNEVAKQENANKDPVVNSTMRDYLASEVSDDVCRRYIFPEDLIHAHDEGIIHIHDMGYISGPITNCELVNLEDMLQNGTVITDTLIEKPHSFSTACNIATQIVAQVASNTYGGQTISLAHLAPFVDVSRQKYRKEIREEMEAAGDTTGAADEQKVNQIAEMRVRKEIDKGIQTIQYQIQTLLTTNGQTPFVSVFMYLDEVPEGRTRDDLALIIEETLRQRYQGIKNEVGVWITPAFPKLLYVLDEDNITPDSKYWYLTELSAKCSAKRMVPDYISAKVMRELKGDVFPCMGCVDGREVIMYRIDGTTYLESFERAWNRLKKLYPVKDQTNPINKYIDMDGVEIYDTVKGFVPCRRMIRNVQSHWMQVTLQNGRTIRVTEDHPFETENRGVVLARDLETEDQIRTSRHERSLKLYKPEEQPISEISVVVSITRYVSENYSYDVTTDSGHFEVSGIYSHNCRSFLTPDTEGMNPDGSHKYYGRFNQGVVTINLVDVACSAEGDEETFWKLMEERTELCHRALQIRHDTLLGTPSDVAPILWQYGAIARLKKGETIDKLLYNNYSTISLGYAGLCECVYRMKGVSHTTDEGHDFAIRVMEFLNRKTKEWRAAENISYSLYGTPMESTTYKFAKCLQRRFGIIPHVTDKNYITNSYHVHVTEPIDAFSKLGFEAEFQALSPGGAISYVEVPNMQNNIPAVLALMRYIYDHIMYAELNTKSDYCMVCGFDGEIRTVNVDGKLIWECPQCGNRDEKKMNICRRVCGYLGVNSFNQGRHAEIADRVLHL